MKYYHVDVFSDHPLSGNGLTVVFPDGSLESGAMLAIAQELKQFETAFVFPPAGGQYPLRIFTVQEELFFAGHPVLGTAGLLHHLHHPDSDGAVLPLRLGTRSLVLESRRQGSAFEVRMNQGQATTLHRNAPVDRRELGTWFGLDEGDLADGYPLSVVSTGLPYLLVPVRGCLDRVCIRARDLESRIGAFGAKFVYFFDPETLECRTWDNTGIYEDIATGSAAGPLLAYLVENGYRERKAAISLTQGRHLGRESRITGSVDDQGEVTICGSVALFAEGEILSRD